MAQPYDNDRTQVQGRTSAGPYAQGNPYAAQPGGAPYAGQPGVSPYANQPGTRRAQGRQPVPSPPQQNPYFPQGVAPAPLRRHRRAGSGRAQSSQPPLERPRAMGQAAPNAPVPAHAPRPRRRGRHGVLSALLWLVMAGVYGLLALRMIPASHAAGSAVPELVSFMPVALVPTIVCLALALLWSRRVLAVACALALAVNGWWHIGYFTGSARVSSEATAAVASTNTTADSYARVMTCNTYNGQASAVDIVNLVREKHVEVLCLQELTDGMVDDLERAGIDELLPYHVVSAGASAISNGGRNGIWTAAPQDNVSRNLLPIDTSSMPAASIQVGDATVRIVSVHPNSPVRGAEDLWDEGLSVIGSLSDYGHAYLIMGDFNSAWDHARFRELLGTTFADAGQASGGGMHMTYPANKAIPALVEIDHIVYSKNSGIMVSSLETAQVSGTDHLALIATLEAL